MQKFGIIVAAGQGTRMKGILPKQFLLLSGKPVLMHTISVFQNAGINTVVVMHRDYIHHWENLCIEHQFNIPHQVVVGGDTRAQSVKNGIDILPEKSFVAVHDAVRPLLSVSFIHMLFHAAEKHGTAVPVIPVKDSLRLITAEGSKAVTRSDYFIVQTPQVFKTGDLKIAFANPGFEAFTDEASLYEASGKNVYLTAGEESNFKLTVPSDLICAEALIRGNVGYLSE